MKALIHVVPSTFTTPDRVGAGAHRDNRYRWRDECQVPELTRVGVPPC